MKPRYRIPDEPAGGHARGWVVEPFWPLLAVMLAGAWLGALLFAVNAWSLRGPTWHREVGLAVAMLAGSAALYALIDSAHAAGFLSAASIKYAFLAVVAWKLAVTYWIFFLQQTGYSLFRYFGGAARNGLVPVLVGALLLDRVVREAVDSPLWRIVVS